MRTSKNEQNCSPTCHQTLSMCSLLSSCNYSTRWLLGSLLHRWGSRSREMRQFPMIPHLGSGKGGIWTQTWTQNLHLFLYTHSYLYSAIMTELHLNKMKTFGAYVISENIIYHTVALCWCRVYWEDDSSNGMGRAHWTKWVLISLLNL